MTIHFLSTESLPNTPCHSRQTPLLHLFTSKSSKKKKGMGPYSLTSYLVFWASFLWIFVLVFWLLLWVCFDVFGIVLVWIIKGIVPMQTCFGWWCHIFSSVCFSWNNLIAWFVIDVLSYVVDLSWSLCLLCDLSCSCLVAFSPVSLTYVYVCSCGVYIICGASVVGIIILWLQIIIPIILWSCLCYVVSVSLNCTFFKCQWHVH